MNDLIIFLILLGSGYAFGYLAEKTHYRSIIKREAETLTLPCTTLKKPLSQDNPCEAALVTGSVVISVDFFKRFLAGLRNMFGGRIKSYESLLDRARREAILRMKESAIKGGARSIINVRIETSSISKNSRGNQSIGSVEILAYGTALKPKSSAV